MKRSVILSTIAALALVALVVGGLSLNANASGTAAPSTQAQAQSQGQVALWPTVPGVRRPMAKVPQSGLRYVAGSGPQINIPFMPPAFGADIRVTYTNPGMPHNEMSIAGNPLNPLNFVAGANDYGTNSGTGYYWSMDGGLNWQGANFPPGYPGGSGIEPGGDPVVAFDSLGNAYFADLGYNASNPCIGGVYIHKSTTGGATWGSPVQVTANTTSRIFNDKEWLAADKSAASPFINRLYMTWSKFDSGGGNCFAGYVGSPIKLKYSADGGNTWGPEVSVSGVSGGQQYDQGSSVAVANNGTVYVMWDNEPDITSYNPDYHVIAKSVNGGATFSPEVRASNGQPNTIPGNVGDDGRLYLKGDPAGAVCFRTNNFPIIAVSPTNPNEIYHVWTDGRWESVQPAMACHHAASGKHTDIVFNRSTDGGATWSAAIRLNDDAVLNGKDQFFPAMDVGSDGTIHVMWNDRRDDPNNSLYHTYYTQSTDGGLSWSANQRVSDVPSNPAKVIFSDGMGFIGDYNGIGANSNNTRVLPVWTDTRSASADQQDMYTDAGQMATPTPAPSPTPCSPGVYSDVPPGSTFYPYITCLANQGVISGYGDCTFRPNNNITRGQIAKVISSAAGYNDDVTGRQTYADVPNTNTFWTWIERLAIHGVMGGYQCGGVNEPCDPQNRPYFRWANNATRAQLAKIDANAAGYNETPTGQTFTDVPPTDPFYVFIERLVIHGVMGGYQCGGTGEPCDPQNRPYFRPYNNVTRGQASKIVANTFFPNCTGR